MATLYLVHDWSTGEKIIFTNKEIMDKFLTDARNNDSGDDLETEEIEVNFDITNIYKLYVFVDTYDNSSHVFNTEGALQTFIKKYGLEFFDTNGYFPTKDTDYAEYGDYKVYELNKDNYINITFDEYYW